MTTTLRPTALSVLNCFPDGSHFEVVETSGIAFFSNSHMPLDGIAHFRQTLSAQSLLGTELSYGVEVEIIERRFEWMSIEMHIPTTLLAGRTSALFSITARAADSSVLSMGCGGILDRGRGYESFVFHSFRLGQNYKTISRELEFPAFPMDEIANEKFVLAIYFNLTDAKTVTIADFRLDLR